MMTNYFEWRKAEGVDEVLSTFDFHELDKVRELYPHGYHGTDKQGRPIYIERVGTLDVAKLFTIAPEERMIRHYVYEYEKLMKLRFPACTAVKGEKVLQGLTVMDLTGGSMSLMNKQMYAMLKLAATVGSNNYPEIMGNLFVVNAPYLFSGVWSVVKTFLDERTRQKIKIMGSGWEKVLLEHVDAAQLPTFLGGKCTCADNGGNCMTSNIGPWNEFEVVEPNAIKRIATGEIIYKCPPIEGGSPAVEESKE